MTANEFDALEYFEKLKAAGVPDDQAKVQAQAFQDFCRIQDGKKELATKGDLRETEFRLQKGIQ